MTANAKSNGLVTTVLIAVVAAAVAGGGGYMVGSRAAQPQNVAVATVNGEAINKTVFYDALVKQAGKDTMEHMIEETLVDQGLKNAKLSVTNADVDAEIKKIKDHIGGEDKFNQALQQYGMTVDQLKEQQMFSLKLTKLVQKDIPMDDASLKKYFDDNRQQFDTREVHSRHILLNTEEEAKAVKAELDKGADFATLAKQKSIDPSAKDNGGDLGSNKPGAMVKEFDDVVFNMKPMEISQPFKSQFGWHVAQVLEVKGDAPNYDKMKDQVKETYLQAQVQAKGQQWLDDQKAKAKITNTLEPKK